MKTSLTLIVALFAACISIGFAQPALPEILVLSTRKHCGPQRFFADIRCGCFFASEDDTVKFTTGLKNKCEDVLEGTLASFESDCALYLNRAGPNPGTRIRRPAVLQRLDILKNQCIRFRQVRFARSQPSNFQILANGRELVELLNHICELYGQEPAIIPPAVA